MSDPVRSNGHAGIPPILAGIRAQDRALAVLAGSIAAPFHAYLFVGPQGTGKRDAALHMAAALVCPNGGCGDCPACRDALGGLHPDIVVVERVGASISVDQAHEVTLLAQRSSSVARRQVIVLVDFHLVGNAAPALLKTIEEPPPSTIFLILADSIPPALTTIASRCVEVEFVSLDRETIESTLVSEGISPVLALAAASVSGGALDRARLFASDPEFEERQARWRSVPERLDGTGAQIVLVARELLSGADALLGVLEARQAAEVTAATQAAERSGERQVPGLRVMQERHRREQRRVRTDELRAGFASLIGTYRSRLGADGLPPRRIGALTQALLAIDAAAVALARNPNELLLVEDLLVVLDEAA